MSIPSPTPPAQSAMTVVRLEVDSYRRLRAAHVQPSPTGLVLVRGRNGAGKSSLIGSMLEALGVEKSELPITEGEHGGSVVLDLGDLVVRKRWTRDSGGKARPALTIEASDGSPLKSPAAVLKELRGRFADPVAFLDMPPAEQVKTVLGVLGLDEELQRLEAIAQSHYDRRRDLGRDADRLGKAAAELAHEVAGLPQPATDGTVDSLASELQAAKDVNARLEADVVALRSIDERGKAATDRLESLRAEIVKLEGEIEQLRTNREGVAERVRGKTKIDVEPIVEAMRAHEDAARLRGRRELAENTQRDADLAQAAHAAAERDLEGARQQIADLLASAKFPIEGMAYDPVGKVLTINAIPFSQASQAERLKAAAAVAMAGSPAIRVMFAREGSLLDEESRMQLAQLAEQSGFQLWLEVVDSNAQGAGVWIEDGEAHLPT